MTNLKFAFLGTPDIASETLEILKNNGYLPSLIITSPDKPSGRGLHLTSSPVSVWADAHNIPCLKPEKITPELINEIFPQVRPVNIHRSDLWPRLFIVVAYGKILPEALIHTPELGTINIHYSLLPKWRGASPLEASLLEISIDEKETKEELKNKLIKVGGDLLCEILPKIIERDITSKIQDESKATYCKKIKKEDGEIDINGNSILNYNKYRAFYGWPGIYFFVEKHSKKIRVKIKEAIFENNTFTIKRVTPEGKKEVSYEDFLRQN